MARANNEMRAMGLRVPFHLAHEKSVHWGKLFPECWRGVWGAQKLKNLPMVKCHIFKTVQMENYSIDGRHTVQSICAWRGLPATNKSGFEKCKMAKLHSIDFLTCSRISWKASAIDERPILANDVLE